MSRRRFAPATKQETIPRPIERKRKTKKKKKRNRECASRHNGSDTATSKNRIRISLQPPSGSRVRLYDRRERPAIRFPSRTPTKANTIAYARSNREANEERKKLAVFSRF